MPRIDRLAVLSCLLAASFACGQAQSPSPAPPRPVTPRGPLTAEEQNHIAVFKAVSPSVVNITAIGLERDFFSANVHQVPRGTGTGFVWDAAGHVVTNFHVIQDANAARVTLNDQTSFRAQLVGVFPDRDLAVLKIDAPSAKLPPIPIGTSRGLQVGQRVYAIGNPFGLDQTMTTGIVSALEREIESVTRRTIRGAIQTDAAINPGNSGGALVDMDGDLIGINTAIFSRSGSSAGVGFAVPAAMVKRVVDSALGGAKTVVRPWLGVKGDTVTGDIAGSLGLSRPQGLVVTDVYPNSPAARAGVRQGDVITAIDGQEINDQGGLNYRIGSRAPNDQVQVAILRDGRAQTLTARVQTLPGEADPDKGLVIQQGPLQGAMVAQLTPALADRLGGDPFATGVVVLGVSGRGYAASVFRQNDLLIAINGRQISTAADAQAASAGRGPWEVVINRGGRQIRGVLR